MSATEVVIAGLFVCRIGLDLRSIANGGTSWRTEFVYGVLFSILAVVLLAVDQYNVFGFAGVALALVSFGLGGLKWHRFRRSATNAT